MIRWLIEDYTKEELDALLFLSYREKKFSLKRLTIVGTISTTLFISGLDYDFTYFTLQQIAVVLTTIFSIMYILNYKAFKEIVEEQIKRIK